jgi:hypothetical protein
VGALFVLTLASAMPAVPSTSYSCLLPALLGIPGGCAKSAFSFVGKTQSVSRLHGVRLQNALCACVATLSHATIALYALDAPASVPRSACVPTGIIFPDVQGTQYVGTSNGEETLTLGAKGMRTSSAKASTRVQDPEVRTRAQGPEVQGTQPVGASNGEKTSTRASSDAEGMRMRGAETRVEDPEVQGTKCVDASGSEAEDAESSAAAVRVQDPKARMNDAKASERAQGPEVQGTLEGSEAIVLSSTSIAST